MDHNEFRADLAFLHLSDIHFRKGNVGDVHDTDADLRNELERDLRAIRANKVSKLDGIIISGDIAYAGLTEEYTFAQSWIERIRELVNCPVTGVMVTPGNHDVNREAVPADGDVDKLHAAIRAGQDLAARDDLLARILRDGAKGEQIFASLAAYNEFAKQYGCNVSAGHPFWERDFQLGNKGTLRVRGMTSTLISGPRDHDTTHKLIYGGAQRMLQREDQVFRWVVGHHPPSWTTEGDEADRVFAGRAVAQLFGHKHEHWITPSAQSVRIIAGAVHPERREAKWDPRYSLLAVRLEDEGNLAMRVYPRVWKTEEMAFMGDFNSRGEDFRDYVMKSK